MSRSGGFPHPHRRSHGPDRSRGLAPADRSDVRSAGGSYRFGWGTGSLKLTGPAIAASGLGPIDAVLLSHDHHDDNLDAAGRALLPTAGTVVTTVPGAKRLGADARGLEPWGTTRLEAPGRPPIEITATPCRHGPPLSRPIVGDVVGFALRWEEQEHGVSLDLRRHGALRRRATGRGPARGRHRARCISAACASRSQDRCATR